jgi:predicted O-linked N-acetylglucosamine transferase (SPINDLY family)
MLGVTETIAHSKSEYIAIAIRLGLDPNWRQHIKQKMLHNQFRLYEDKACVVALEEFYQRAVRERIR